MRVNLYWYTDSSRKMSSLSGPVFCPVFVLLTWKYIHILRLVEIRFLVRFPVFAPLMAVTIGNRLSIILNNFIRYKGTRGGGIEDSYLFTTIPSTPCAPKLLTLDQFRQCIWLEVVLTPKWILPLKLNCHQASETLSRKENMKEKCMKFHMLMMFFIVFRRNYYAAVHFRPSKFF